MSDKRTKSKPSGCAECKRLRSINAALLAALKQAAKLGPLLPDTLAIKDVFEDIHDIIDKATTHLNPRPAGPTGRRRT